MTNKFAVIITFLVIAIIPYIFISFYCEPVADDFYYANRAQNNSAFNVLISDYMNWSGRYSASVTGTFNPIVFNSFTGYKLIPILFIVLNILSFFGFIHCLSNGKLKKSESIICSLLFTLLFLNNMPIISEGLYWYSGSITYFFGCILFVNVLTLLISFLNQKYMLKNKMIHLIILFFMLFITMGYNEILIIAIMLFFSIMMLTVILKKLQHSRIILYLSIACIIFAAIVLLAPGNFARDDLFSGNYNLWNSLIMSFFQTVRFFFIWVSSLPLLLLSILYYPLNKKLSEQIPIFRQSFYLKPYISFLLLFVVIFIGTFPPYFATGILGQHRTMNVSYFLFLILWFINLTVIYNKNLILLNFNNKILVIIFYILIWGGLMFTKNSYHVFDDIRTEACFEYKTQMVERRQLMQSNQDTIYFNPILNPPKTLFILEITKNPNHWINQGYNTYFKKQDKKVILKKTE